jgi:hypothetical protein
MEGAVVTDGDGAAAPDLEAEARMVAEALGAELRQRSASGGGLLEWAEADEVCWFSPGDALIRSVASLARRLREAEQEREEWKAAAEYHSADVKILLGHHEPRQRPTCGDGTASVPVKEPWDTPGWRQAQRDFG